MKKYTKLIVFLTVAFGSLIWMMSLDVIPQNLNYHNFADNREVSSICNFADVISNVPFVLLGAFGLWSLFGRSDALLSWRVFFIGFFLTGFGSIYYHLEPNNATLVWDRLPMTIAFMGVFVAVCCEHISLRVERFALPLALIVGISSVIYWHYFGDLRFYYWIQLLPVLVIPLVLILFKGEYSHRRYYLYSFIAYLLAKIVERYDLQIYEFTQQLISGHSLKHYIASLVGVFVILMLSKRRAV